MESAKTGREAMASMLEGWHEMPHDPQVAGFTKKRRAAVSAIPDSNGNRAERRAAARRFGKNGSH